MAEEPIMPMPELPGMKLPQPSSSWEVAGGAVKEKRLDEKGLEEKGLVVVGAEKGLGDKRGEMPGAATADEGPEERGRRGSQIDAAAAGAAGAELARVGIGEIGVEDGKKGAAFLARAGRLLGDDRPKELPPKGSWVFAPPPNGVATGVGALIVEAGVAPLGAKGSSALEPNPLEGPGAIEEGLVPAIADDPAEGASDGKALAESSLDLGAAPVGLNEGAPRGEETAA